jgi:hypothetical protein
MPYARPFVQVTVEGFFGATEATKLEDWRAGFKLSSVGGGSFDPANLLVFVTNISNSIQTFHATAGVGAGTDSKIKSIAAAYIGVDGLYVLGGLQPTTRYTYATPVGGAGGPVGPYSQSCCITFRSLVTRGPASHGRMYWPATALSIVSGSGKLSSAQQTTYCTAAKTMFNNINVVGATTFGSGSNLALCSRVGAGREAIVNQIGIGARLDSMESREKKIPEAHVYQALSGSLLLQEERDRELADLYRDYEDSL